MSLTGSFSATVLTLFEAAQPVLSTRFPLRHKVSAMVIRRATPADRPAVWSIFRNVIAGGDTYVFDPALDEEKAMAYWFAEGTSTYVAVGDGQVLGTYIFKPNQPGLGSHIANGSYMVSETARGKGVGSAMCAHSLVEAQREGFLGMQFNIVVSTNEAAVHLWKKHGFTIIGTVPKAYRHSRLGLVDAHVMFRELS